MTAAVLAMRAARRRLLESAELGALGDRARSAYSEMREEARRAANDRKFCANRAAARPDRYSGTDSGLEYSEALASAAVLVYREAVRAFERRRAELMAENGVDESCLAQTVEEHAQRDAHTNALLDCPPIGWGGSMPDYATRRARWQGRPEQDRLSDLRERELVHP